MNPSELTDQQSAELYHPWAVDFIKKRGRKLTGIDCLRHHGDYVMANGSQADMGDLLTFSRLFNLAPNKARKRCAATLSVGSCPRLITNMLSTLRSVRRQSEKSASE